MIPVKIENYPGVLCSELQGGGVMIQQWNVNGHLVNIQRNPLFVKSFNIRYVEILVEVKRRCIIRPCGRSLQFTHSRFSAFFISNSQRAVKSRKIILLIKTFGVKPRLLRDVFSSNSTFRTRCYVRHYECYYF